MLEELEVITRISSLLPHANPRLQLGDRLVFSPSVITIPKEPPHLRVYGMAIARISAQLWAYPSHFAHFPGKYTNLSVTYLSLLNTVLLGLAKKAGVLNYFLQHGDFFRRLIYYGVNVHEEFLEQSRARQLSKEAIKKKPVKFTPCVFEPCTKKQGLPMNSKPITDEEWEEILKLGEKSLSILHRAEVNRSVAKAKAKVIAKEIGKLGGYAEIIVDGGSVGNKLLALLIKELKRQKIKIQVHKFRDEEDLFYVTKSVAKRKNPVLFFGTVVDLRALLPILKTCEGVLVITNYANESIAETESTLLASSFAYYEHDWNGFVEVH